MSAEPVALGAEPSEGICCRGGELLEQACFKKPLERLYSLARVLLARLFPAFREAGPGRCRRGGGAEHRPAAERRAPLAPRRRTAGAGAHRSGGRAAGSHGACVGRAWGPAWRWAPAAIASASGAAGPFSCRTAASLLLAAGGPTDPAVERPWAVAAGPLSAAGGRLAPQWQQTDLASKSGALLAASLGYGVSPE